jgi:glycosyltransferase involved in cell wall biosynthesis
LFYFANELLDHQKFEQAIEFYKQFLSTGKGWVEDNISACGNLADCYHHLGDKESEILYLFKTFEYDTPRADYCCRLGYHFLEQNQLHQAIFWYKLATQLDKPINSWGKINHACWTWLPNWILCNCYQQLGNYELAYEHNTKAANYLPDNALILQNKSNLETILQQKQLIKQAKKWRECTAQVDQHFLPKMGTKLLKVTYVMNHMQVCGGVKVVVEQTNNLVKRGHQVSIICREPVPNWINVLANYIQVPSEMSLAETIPMDTDVIVTTYWDQLLDCYSKCKAPILHFEQGDTYIFDFDKYDQDFQELLFQHWSIPVPILTVSSGLAMQIEEIFQRDPQVLHNAINDSVFYPPSNDQRRSLLPRVLFVGPEQWPFKGIKDIIVAIQIVREAGYSIEPIWVTQIEPESKFEGILYINPEQNKLAEIYRTCDLYVCGSYFESFGLPPLEAMASGCAVISTRNIGVLEYAKHDENCLLTDIGDPQSIANSIIELLVDEQKRALLVKGGYKTAKKFKIEFMIEHLEKYLYGALQQ